MSRLCAQVAIPLLLTGGGSILLGSTPASAASSTDTVYIYSGASSTHLPLPAGTPDVATPLTTALTNVCQLPLPGYSIANLTAGQVLLCVQPQVGQHERSLREPPTWGLCFRKEAIRDAEWRSTTSPRAPRLRQSWALSHLAPPANPANRILQLVTLTHNAGYGRNGSTRHCPASISCRSRNSGKPYKAGERQKQRNFAQNEAYPAYGWVPDAKRK